MRHRVKMPRHRRNAYLAHQGTAGLADILAGSLNFDRELDMNFTSISNTAPHHRFDMVINSAAMVSLQVEELPENVQLLSDCLSTASSVSTASTAGCGCIATAGCVYTAGSVVSTGNTVQQ